MNEKELSKEESLALITNMIIQAKSNFSRHGSFHFLLWGWVIAIANFSHYILDKYQLTDVPYAVWIITIPAAIVSFGYGFRKSRESRVANHLDTIYMSMWIAITVMIIICLIFMFKLGYNHNPLILLFAGLGTFLNGVLLRFKPILFGGIVLWIGAVMGLMTNVADQQLIAGFAVLLGYLIPGHLLRKAENG